MNIFETVKSATHFYERVLPAIRATRLWRTRIHIRSTRKSSCSDFYFGDDDIQTQFEPIRFIS